MCFINRIIVIVIIIIIIMSLTLLAIDACVYVLGLSEIDELDGKLRSIAVRHTYVHIPDIILSFRGCSWQQKIGDGGLMEGVSCECTPEGRSATPPGRVRKDIFIWCSLMYEVYGYFV